MKLVLIILIYLLFSNNLYSQFEKTFKDKYGPSAYGTNFLFSIPSPYYNNLNEVVEIYFFSEFNAEINITGGSFTTSLNINAYEKSSVIVPLEAVTPEVISISQFLSKNSSFHQDKALEINSSMPVKVFLSFKSDSDLGELTQIYPNGVLGNDYIIQSYEGRPFQTGSLSPIATVTSAEDENEVTIIVGGNSNASINLSNNNYYFGDTIKVNMNKGDVLQLCNFKNNSTELSGTRISSRLKINVISGHYCANVPVDVNPCNYIIESNLPTTSFGNKYYIPSISERQYPGVLRIYAIENGTKVYENGAEVLSLRNSTPGMKGNSWDEIRVNDKSTEKKISVITSNKPIGISYLNTGQTEDNQSNMKASLVHLLPTNFYTKHSNIIIPNIIALKNSNKQKLILPSENQRLSNDIHFKEYGSETWFQLNEYYNNTKRYDSEYEFLEEFMENFEGEVYSEKGHNTFIYSYSLEGINKTFASNSIERFWKINSSDNANPKIIQLDTIRNEDNYYLNMIIQDFETGLYGCYLIGTDEENEEIVFQKDVSNYSSNIEIIEFEFTPKEKTSYKFYAFDNANNLFEYDFGLLFIEKEVLIPKDSLVASVDFIDFGLVEITKTSEFNIEITSHSNTTTEIVNIYTNSENFEFNSDIVLPLEIDSLQTVSFNLNYNPQIEYTELEEIENYGKVDYGEFIIETKRDTFSVVLIGQGGIAKILVGFNQEIDSVEENKSKMLNYQSFTIENIGTYELKITGIDKENITDGSGLKVIPNNITFINDFELDKDYQLKSSKTIEINASISLSDAIQIEGITEGFYEYNFPLNSNAQINESENILNLQFIVYQDNSSVNKIPDDYISQENDIITFNQTKFTNDATIKIIDLNGKIIFNESSLFKNNKISLTQYKNKILILIILDQKNIYFKKVLI